MSKDAPEEFSLTGFARHYDAVSDTFIDIRKAAESLKKHIPTSTQIFEIGLGTGYFAKQFINDGYDVCGIQPRDEMLLRLRQECPSIRICADEKLETYEFAAHYPVIVSHSSVFLFTRLEASAGPHGETSASLAFQSFSSCDATAAGLRKVLAALSPGGRLFINIQTNPLRFVEVGPSDDRFTFEMVRCTYMFDFDCVEKTFRATYQNDEFVTRQKHYCLRYPAFLRLLGSVGGRAQVTEDTQWVIVESLTST